MQDLISRQALCEYAMNQKDKSVTPNDIMRFPSAQPEIIRCKECRHRIVNNHYGERGYLKIKAYCELDSDDPYELGRDAGNDDWFCADAERRTDEGD